MGALDEAAGQVRSAGAWLTFKAAASVAGAGVVMVLAVYALGRFMLPSEADRQEVERLRSEKAQLAKRGGRIRLDRCGPANRLCVEITPGQGVGKGQADFQGSWVRNDPQGLLRPRDDGQVQVTGSRWFIPQSGHTHRDQTEFPRSK